MDNDVKIAVVLRPVEVTIKVIWRVRSASLRSFSASKRNRFAQSFHSEKTYLIQIRHRFLSFSLLFDASISVNPLVCVELFCHI